MSEGLTDRRRHQASVEPHAVLSVFVPCSGPCEAGCRVPAAAAAAAAQLQTLLSGEPSRMVAAFIEPFAVVCSVHAREKESMLSMGAFHHL